MKVGRIALALGVAMLLASSPSLAVDSGVSEGAPDLTVVRAKIKAKDFSSALIDLSGMID